MTGEGAVGLEGFASSIMCGRSPVDRWLDDAQSTHNSIPITTCRRHGVLYIKHFHSSNPNTIQTNTNRTNTAMFWRRKKGAEGEAAGSAGSGAAGKGPRVDLNKVSKQARAWTREPSIDRSPSLPCPS